MFPSQKTPRAQPETGPDDSALEEPGKHRGRWVAWSPDGRRLVASCTTLAALDAEVRAAGENPEEVLLDKIPDGDFIASGSELS
ncbi:MAG: hypothetical protein L0Y72_23730 [Gemmataceae bacterium]|nr:hypothetical protein [Gemmataceae bacterium]MCI0742055.1 hypothetical protein [Gemmataceae bacterium]